MKTLFLSLKTHHLSRLFFVKMNYGYFDLYVAMFVIILMTIIFGVLLIFGIISFNDKKFSKRKKKKKLKVNPDDPPWMS